MRTTESKQDHPSRHPLLVLVVATILGSILVPIGAAKLSKQRADEEARRDLVIRILQYDSDTRQALLSLHTRLYISHENLTHLKPDAAELRAQQLKLADVALTQYLGFDNHVWTTAKQIQNELRVRQIVSPSTLADIKHDFEEYHGLVWNARNAICVLWMKCVNDDYRPDDPEIDKLHGEADTERKILDEKGASVLARAAARIR